MSSKILVTGKPGCGKTTLLREIVAESQFDFKGFFTDEIREKNNRVGFKLVFTDHKSAMLAHKALKTGPKVGAYGVDLKQFESILEKEKMNILKSPFVVIDEIGKMELFSERFKMFLKELVESPRILLCSILYNHHPVADRIKSRDDVKLFYLERSNYSIIKKEIDLLIREQGRLKPMP